eukprot:6141054-Pleurochrysis_carterae.AAC.2
MLAAPRDPHRGSRALSSPLLTRGRALRPGVDARPLSSYPAQPHALALLKALPTSSAVVAAPLPTAGKMFLRFSPHAAAALSQSSAGVCRHMKEAMLKEGVDPQLVTRHALA